MVQLTEKAAWQRSLFQQSGSTALIKLDMDVTSGVLVNNNAIYVKKILKIEDLY